MNKTNKLCGRNVAILVLALCGVSPVVQSWVSPAHRRTPLSLKSQTTTRLSSSESGSEGGETPEIDISGKTIYQRIFYRLSPLSEVDLHNGIVVEERVRFKADEARGEGYMKPIGARTLILRNGKVEDGEIGDEVLEINVKESLNDAVTHSGAGRDLAMEATIATILYLSSNPKYVEGNVLELGCGVGLAGLLGSIGAGALTASDDGKSDSDGANSGESNDILTIPKGTPLTDELKQLTLSDEDAENLDLAVANVRLSNVPKSKVNLEELSWRKRSLNRRTPKLFHTIVASDLNYNFPEAKELAHTVAHQLEAFSTWDTMKGNSKSPPTFVHMCLDAREDVSYLHKFLAKGYRMNVNTGYVKLEKLVFVYQMLLESEPEEKLDELELELQEFQETTYQSLTAQHDPAYTDGAGEYFFPMETGEYESASSQTYLEPESDGSKWY